MSLLIYYYSHRELDISKLKMWQINVSLLPYSNGFTIKDENLSNATNEQIL